MTKEEVIKRLESIKETYETFAGGLDDIHLDIEALGIAIGYLKSGLESPAVKTISKDGEVVISGFKEANK